MAVMPLSLEEYHQWCISWVERLRGHVRPTETVIEDTLARGEKVLLEGGPRHIAGPGHTVPIPSSPPPGHPLAAPAIGAGISPQVIAGVTGIFKAYCTRVGSGSLPTEMDEATGDLLRERAGELWGHYRQDQAALGWFDAVAGRYSASINGFTSLVLTRLDILDGLPRVKICVGYKVDGRDTNRFPAAMSHLERCQPIYEELAGWDRPTFGATRVSQLPPQAKGLSEAD